MSRKVQSFYEAPVGERLIRALPGIKYLDRCPAGRNVTHNLTFNVDVFLDQILR